MVSGEGQNPAQDPALTRPGLQDSQLTGHGSRCPSLQPSLSGSAGAAPRPPAVTEALRSLPPQPLRAHQTPRPTTIHCRSSLLQTWVQAPPKAAAAAPVYQLFPPPRR